MQDMGRINRSNQSRRAQRQRERLTAEDTSAWQVGMENLADGFKFQTQGANALGKEIARGVTRESASLAKDFLKVGASLAIGTLAGVVTLGLTEQPIKTSSRGRGRRRRGNNNR